MLFLKVTEHDGQWQHRPFWWNSDRVEMWSIAWISTRVTVHTVKCPTLCYQLPLISISNLLYSYVPQYNKILHQLVPSHAVSELCLPEHVHVLVKQKVVSKGKHNVIIFVVCFQYSEHKYEKKSKNVLIVKPLQMLIQTNLTTPCVSQNLSMFQTWHQCQWFAITAGDWIQILLHVWN
jgi:hypothetical protein